MAIIKIQTIIIDVSNESPKYLVAKRVPQDGGYWNLPVGTQDESDFDDIFTINREINEEFGIVDIAKSSIIIKNAIFTWIKVNMEVTEKSYMLIIKNHLDIQLNKSEHDEYKWLDFNSAFNILEKDGNKNCLSIASEKLKVYLNIDKFNLIKC